MIKIYCPSLNEASAIMSISEKFYTNKSDLTKNNYQLGFKGNNEYKRQIKTDLRV